MTAFTPVWPHLEAWVDLMLFSRCGDIGKAVSKLWRFPCLRILIPVAGQESKVSKDSSAHVIGMHKIQQANAFSAVKTWLPADEGSRNTGHSVVPAGGTPQPAGRVVIIYFFKFTNVVTAMQVFT